MKAGEFCKYNDCGWCYYNGSLDTTAEQGQCNKPTMCLVMKMEQRDKWERIKIHENTHTRTKGT